MVRKIVVWLRCHEIPHFVPGTSWASSVLEKQGGTKSPHDLTRALSGCITSLNYIGLHLSAAPFHPLPSSSQPMLLYLHQEISYMYVCAYMQIYLFPKCRRIICWTWRNLTDCKLILASGILHVGVRQTEVWKLKTGIKVSHDGLGACSLKLGKFASPYLTYVIFIYIRRTLIHSCIKESTYMNIYINLIRKKLWHISKRYLDFWQLFNQFLIKFEQTKKMVESNQFCKPWRSDAWLNFIRETDKKVVQERFYKMKWLYGFGDFITWNMFIGNLLANLGKKFGRSWICFSIIQYD